jgi:predicted RecA/RadA family phage recombinase
MKNSVQNGNVITVTATATTLSGQLTKMGVLCGVATIDAAIGAEFEMEVVGVFTVPVADGITMVEGEAAYLIGDTGTITNVATDNVACGIAVTGGTATANLLLR